MADNYLWGAAVTGSWDVASNWDDTTANENPALAAPGAADSVTIGAAAGGSTHVITGTGNSASLTLSGPTVLAGQFTTGAFTLNSGGTLALNAGDTLAVDGNATVSSYSEMGYAVTISGGALSITGNLTTSADSFSVTSGGTLSVEGNVSAPGEGGSYQIADSTFTVAGDFIGDYSSVGATDGAVVQLGGLSGLVYLTADATSSVEIGDVGGAGVGAITIDSGVSATLSGSFTAPGIVDNGAIVVAAGGSLALDGGVFNPSYNDQTGAVTYTYVSGGLTGSGQVDIGAGSNLTVEGVNPNSANTIDFTGAGGVLTLPESALNASDVFRSHDNGWRSAGMSRLRKQICAWSPMEAGSSRSNSARGVLSSPFRPDARTFG